MFDDLSGTNLASFQGIRVGQFPCDGLRLYSNTITGGTIGYLNGSGIYITESANCIINCNETNNTNDGIFFSGLCDNTDLSKNRFNFHARGLNLSVPSINSLTVIGPQTKKENRWFGTNSPIEAFAPNLASAQASLFGINSSDLNSDYWPSPRKIAAVNDNMQWFIMLQGEEPSNDFSCLTGKTLGENGLADADQRLLNNTYTAPAAYPALDWEARWRFADRLNRNPELGLLNSNISDYFQNTTNETYSRLNQVYQSYLSRWDLPNEVEGLTLAHLSAIEQRFALDNLLPDNPGVAAEMYAQMLNFDANIKESAALLESGLTNWATAVDQSMNDLLAEVSGIACSQSYEKDMQTVLGLMIQSHFNGGILSEPQVSVIKQIGEKCRYSGGYAVVLARSYFEQQEVYSQDLACSNIEERGYSSISADQLGLLLSPNPVEQTLTLAIEKPFHEGILHIFNSQGSLVRTQILTARNNVLPVGEFATGIYRLSLSIDGAIPVSKTFVKVQ